MRSLDDLPDEMPGSETASPLAIDSVVVVEQLKRDPEPPDGDERAILPA